MNYCSAAPGRIFVVKFDDNDILLKEIERLARKERIASAVFVFLGALRKGDLVTGPQRPVIPPLPNWKTFKDGWEALGVGTIFRGAGGSAQIHIHTAMGKRSKTLTGCVRKDSRVFLVIEAVIWELVGAKASKRPDPKTGLNLLRIL